MKNSILTILFLCSNLIFGQNPDLIVTTTGDSINCKIVDISAEQIQFIIGDSRIIPIKRIEVASYKYSFTPTAISKNNNESTTYQKNPLDIEIVFVKGGIFTMGSLEEVAFDNEKPLCKVTLKSFIIGKYEVTEEQWQIVMGNNPSKNPKGNNYPVENVSWTNIVGNKGEFVIINGTKYYENGFIYKLNKLTGKKYRLPTEAEWEYAARGGSQSKGYIFSGSDFIDNVAWNLCDSKHPVGDKSPNELGIYDMSGNVWEWCSDWYGYYSKSSKKNPTGPGSPKKKDYRVLRGGCWKYETTNCRVSYRGGWSQDSGSYNIGFRLVLQ